jgi:hypothetical protein
MARTVGGVVEYGLYDTVSGEWFLNVGTGELVGIPETQPITVSLGGAACTNVTVISDIELTCVTSAHAVGLVDAAVTIGDDTLILPQSYTYVATPDPNPISPIPPEPIVPTPPNTGRRSAF